jgi:hypothetical protein
MANAIVLPVYAGVSPSQHANESSCRLICVFAGRGHQRCHRKPEGFGTPARQLENDESYTSPSGFTSDGQLASKAPTAAGLEDRGHPAATAPTVVPRPPSRPSGRPRTPQADIGGPMTPGRPRPPAEPEASRSRFARPSRQPGSSEVAHGAPASTALCCCDGHQRERLRLPCVRPSDAAGDRAQPRAV